MLTRRGTRSTPDAAQVRKLWTAASASLVVLLVSVVLWIALVRATEGRVHKLVEGKAVLVSTDLADLLEDRVRALERMASRWEVRVDTSRSEWVSDASQYQQDDAGYFAIAWVDQSRRVRWMVPSSADPDSVQRMLEQAHEVTAELDRVEASGSSRLTEALILPDRSLGVLSLSPLYREQNFEGFILGALSFDELFDGMLPEEIAGDFAIAVLDGNRQVFGSSLGSELYDKWMVERTIRVRNSVWRVHTWPRPPLIADSGTELPSIVLGVGTLAALLIGLTIYFAQESAQRAGLLEARVEERTAELRQALEALKQSEAKYQQLYETAPDMFFSLDPQSGVIIQCNQTLADELGYSKQDIIGKKVWELYHPDHVEASKQAFQAFVHEGELQDVELEIQRRDGSSIDVLLNASAVRDESGQIMYSSSIWRDISERKRAEQQRDQLLISEREQRRVAETLGRVGLALSATLELESLVEMICKESVSLFDAGAAFVWLVEGDSLVGMAGYGVGREHFIGTRAFLDDEQVLGARVIHQRRPIYVNHAQQTGSLKKNLVELFQTQAILGVPLLKGMQPIGSLMILDTEQPDRFGPNDLEIASVLGSHVAVAVENARLYEQERQLAQMKDDFIAHVSHELRTPLHTLKGFIGLLQSGRVLDPQQQQDLLARASHDTDRLSEQVSDLLEAAHIDAVGLKLNYADADAAEIVNQTVESIRLIARDRGVDLRLDLPQAPLLIRTEPRRLRQVIRNLVENAIQYSESGSAVQVQLAQQDSFIHLAVTDHGPGIPEQAQQRLFDRFYQVAIAGRREEGGVGLGLYITKMIVEAHAGTIEVESEPGRGSTFRVQLPVGTVETENLELS